MAAIAPLLAALSLNTNHSPVQPVQTTQTAPRHPETPASSRRCARTRLKLFKQAVDATLRRGHHKNMTSRPARREVIEISDDDDEEDLPNHSPRAHSLLSQRSHISLVDGDDEAEPDSSSESDFSDPASPPLTNRRMILHHRPRNNEEARQRSAGSGTTTDASSGLFEAPRRQRACQILHARESSVSTDEDLGYVTAPPIVSQLNESGPSAQVVARSTPDHRRAVIEGDQCPYYYDEKLEVKMYRGQGYEKFPVVLGTLEGHKEICDKWDAQFASKIMKQDSHSFDTGIPPPTRSIAELELEGACLQAVLQIFPEIEHEFVRNLYRKGYSGAVAEDIVGTVSGALIADIAESETYPKQKNLKRKASLAARDDTGVTIGWNKGLPKNRDYQREAIILLATVFDHIPTHYISKIVQEKQSLFDAFGVLSDNEINFYNPAAGERPYKRLRQPRKGLEAKYQRKSFETRDGHQHVSLVNELQAARQNQEREASKIKRQKASDNFESENLALHIAQGSMVECQCCFDDKPINRAVPCEGDEAHFFCNDCVRRQAESQVGAMKYEMLCMDTSGCKAELSTEGVAQAIPLQLYDKLAFNQQQAEISSAGIQGLEMCPFCDFKAICEPVEVDSVFDCQNPDCGLATCRKCKERSHLPKTCEEVKDDKGLGARHKVEEARSEAMMRTCPKCKVKLIKEHGCNKMVCTNCRAIMCYVCQKDISGTGKEHGYDHFHRAGATCALHDQTGVDRHKAEADAAEIAAIAKAKAEYEDIDEKALQIETGNYNKKRSAAKKTAVVPPPQPQLRAMQHPVFYGGPPMAPFAAIPQFPAEFDHNQFAGHMNQAFQPILPFFPNQGQGQGQGQGHVLGQLPQDLGQMQEPIGQPPAYRPPNVGGAALPLNPGVRRRQALQALLQQGHQNRA